MGINKTIANRFYSEVVNKGDLSVMNSIVSPDFIDHNASPDLPRGVEGLKKFLQMIASAFPDIKVQVEDMISEDDKVAVRITVTGTHKGVLLGTIPPTEKSATWTGIDILKIKSGKITDRWSQRDLLGMMKQIGFVK